MDDTDTTRHVHDDDESLHHHPEDMTPGENHAGRVGTHLHDDDESMHHHNETGALDDHVPGLGDAVGAASASGDTPIDQLRNLVVWLVGQLVDEPGSVQVDAVERGSSVQIQVRLPETELGKVIGRGGRIAKSIRTALMIVGSRHHLRVSLDIEGQA